MQHIIILSDPMLAELLESIVNLTRTGEFVIVKATSLQEVYDTLSLVTHDLVHSLIIGGFYREIVTQVSAFNASELRTEVRVVIAGERDVAREQCRWLETDGWFSTWPLDTAQIQGVLRRLDRVVQLV